MEHRYEQRKEAIRAILNSYEFTILSEHENSGGCIFITGALAFPSFVLKQILIYKHVSIGLAVHDDEKCLSVYVLNVGRE